MSEREKERKYSPLGNLRDKIRSASAEQLSHLNERDLKTLILWLEAEQLETAMMVAVEDDPVENAKGRGAVEMLLTLNARLFTLLAQRSQPKKEEVNEEEEDV